MIYRFIIAELKTLEGEEVTAVNDPPSWSLGGAASQHPIVAITGHCNTKRGGGGGGESLSSVSE